VTGKKILVQKSKAQSDKPQVITLYHQAHWYKQQILILRSEINCTLLTKGCLCRFWWKVKHETGLRRPNHLDVFLLLGDRQGNPPGQTTSIMLYAASIGFQLCLCTVHTRSFSFNTLLNAEQHRRTHRLVLSLRAVSCAGAVALFSFTLSSFLACSGMCLLLLWIWWVLKQSPFKEPKSSGSATPTPKGSY
jgi:hypothetical protein